MSTKTSGHYKGCFVTAYPYELQAGGWSAEFDLLSDRGGDVVVAGFYGSCILPSEDEAIRAALHSACRKFRRRPQCLPGAFVTLSMVFLLASFASPIALWIAPFA
jgi:hypothetical protein